MAILASFGKAVGALWSMVVGLRVTGTNFLRPQETIHYPRQEVPREFLETFRGHVELVGTDEDPAKPRCVGCGLCAELCPSSCLRVDAEDIPGAVAPPAAPTSIAGVLMPVLKFKTAPPSQTPPRRLLAYHYTYHTCSLCGLCVQNCPAGSLRFSANVYLSGTSRQDFEIDLMRRLVSRAAKGAGHA